MVTVGALPLLETKTRPPKRRPDGLRRDRLVNALLEQSDRKLMLVVAPAGYGKTTVLIDLIEAAPQPVAFLTLDAEDRDLQSFVTYLVQSLRAGCPAFGSATLAALAAARASEHQTAGIARVFTAELEQSLSAVTLLVLDDFHEVSESSAITGFLDEVLRSLPESLRIVLSSRTLPGLTVSRLAVQSELFGLGRDELAFSAGEVAALFELRYKIRLSQERTQAITAAAEGWIAGLLLSMAGIWEGLVDHLVVTRGAEGPLYEYLADEVFDRLPADLREFLLATSVLRLIDQDSCAALLGARNWLQLLRRIEQDNLFISRLGGPVTTFRYHQLFRDFLRTRLQREDPARFHSLHERAARYFRKQHDWSAALEHLRSAADERRCAELLVQAAPELEAEGRWHFLAEGIDGLPARTLNRNARLLLCRARAAAMTGDLAGADRLTTRALSACRGGNTAPLYAWILQVRGNVLRRLGQIDAACEALERARALGGTDDALLATVRRDLAGCYGVRGDLEGAARELRPALAYFERHGNAYEAARAAFGLGAALGRLGDLDEAVAKYHYAIARFRAVGDRGNTAVALNNLGYLLFLRGELPEARRLLHEALQASREAAYPPGEAATLDSLGAVLLAEGDADGAGDSFRRGHEIARAAGDLWCMAATAEGLGYCSLLRGELTAAEESFVRAGDLARELGSGYREALVEIGRGVLAMAGNDAERACELLTSAGHSFARLGSARDTARAQFWLAQVHQRRGDYVAAGAAFQAGAAVATGLRLPVLADLAARWNAAAFGAIPAGGYAAFQAAVLNRISRAPAAEPHAVSACSQPELKFAAYSFGAGRVVGRDGAAVEWPREKARELFFYLLHGGPSRSERILANLWPESNPAQARARLYSSAYALRRATHPEVLQVVGQTYSVNAETIGFHDGAEFDALVERIRLDPDAGQRLSAMEQLTRLYAGPFMGELPSEWAEERRRSFELRYLEVVQSLMVERAARKAWQTCLAAALEGLRVDPFCETFYAYAARSYLSLGNREAARRMYREGRSRLAQALAV